MIWKGSIAGLVALSIAFAGLPGVSSQVPPVGGLPGIGVTDLCVEVEEAGGGCADDCEILGECAIESFGRLCLHANYEGRCGRTYSDTNNCNDYYYYGNLGWYWNDVTSSGEAWGTCDHLYIYEHHGFTGDSDICSPGCDYFGSLNDKVSSWVITG